MALVLLLPHGSSSAGKNSGQTGTPQNITNITNPLTTIGPSTTSINQSVYTTTVTSGQGNQSFNYTNYIDNLTNTNGQGTTSIFYAYCVGSLTPPFNQSYYSELGPSGAINWTGTSSYPIPFSGGACTSTGSTVYCIGNSQIFANISEKAYYAPITPGGIGTWAATTNYPVPFSSGSCSTYNSYIYCIGTTSSQYSNEVFYAQILPTGLGPWKQTTNYPVKFYGGECNAYNGYIYCVGDTYINVSSLVSHYANSGNSLSANQLFAGGNIPGLNISFDYYAPISSVGVGSWTRMSSTPQPVDGGSCTISNATIYCLGGSSAEEQLGVLSQNATALNQSSGYLSSLFSNDTSASFYASIESNGTVGTWNYSAPYLGQIGGGRCASNGSNIYCIGGLANSQSVYFSQLSNVGVDSWLPTTDYPIPFYFGYCATNA